MAAYQTDIILRADVATAGTLGVPYEPGKSAANYNANCRIEYDSGGALTISQASVHFSTAGFVVVNNTGSTWTAGKIVRLSVERREYPAQNAAYSKAGAPSVILLGDSLTANNIATVGSTFANFAAEGSWNWANALSGNRFSLVANKGTAGNTLQDMLNRFDSDVAAIPSKYVRLVGGVNDLYAEFATASTVISRFEQLIQRILDLGRIPIVSTIWARSFSTAGILKAHLTVNDYLRQAAYKNRDIKLWDGFRVTVDSTSTACGIRSGWTYDSSPSIHVNNLGAYYLGKAESLLLNSLEPSFTDFGGFEDYVNCDTSQGINYLDNVTLQGSTGTVGTGGGGSAPSNWTVQRASGGGSPTFTCVPGNVTDSSLGIVVGRYIHADITAGAANNEVQFLSANLSTRATAGATYEAECWISVESPSNVDRVRVRVTPDSGSAEAGWFGSNSQTAANFPEAFTFKVKTAPITSQGTPTIFQFDARIRFSAAGSAVFKMWQPRIRRIA